MQETLFRPGEQSGFEALAENINILARFCGVRDVPALTAECLQAVYGFAQADVMALFGGSILCGVDVLAEAMRSGIAKHYVIVGGEGHTTESLRQRVHAEYPTLDTAGKPEARVFAACLKQRHGLEADFLECASTNCGNNITYLLELLRREGIACRRIILTQDASMQRRMAAGLRKYAPDLQIINYTAYAAEVVAQDGGLAYRKPIWGMWDMERYISLLLGEIPRLSDDENGYGPKGKGFIAHEDIPPAVQAAFDALRLQYAGLVRTANPAYASKE